MRRLACALALLALAGCGYRDDNPEAVRTVAQTWMDALSEPEPAAACRVLGPELQVVLASQAGGVCETFVEGLIQRRRGSHPLGRVTMVDDMHARVEIDGVPGGYVGVVRYGSFWRVTEAWQLQ